MQRLALLLSIAGVLWCAPRTAYATVLTYETVDLDDATAGEDLWEYRYLVSDRTFLADEGFTVFFDYGLHASLESPAAVPGWDAITLPPIPDLLADGLFDALALTDAASLEDPFVVRFVWLGPEGSVPGAQPFEVYRLDAAGFTVLEEGRTTRGSSIPEPSSLLLTTIVALEALRQRRRFARAPVRS